jgi:hypothetical protein
MNVTCAERAEAAVDLTLFGLELERQKPDDLSWSPGTVVTGKVRIDLS